MKNQHFKWILKAIKSCNTIDQLQSAGNLVNIYHNKYQDQLDRFMLNKCIGDTMDRSIMNKQTITQY